MDDRPDQSLSTSPSTPDPLADLGSAALNLLQRHDLLMELALRQIRTEAAESVSLTPQDEAAVLHSLAASVKLKEGEDLEAALLERNLVPREVIWKAQLPLRLHRFSSERFGHKAEAHFLSRKSELDHVVYSLLRVGSHELALELYLRIAGGESNFADLAAEFAEGPERTTRGIVGPVPLQQAHPVLQERLRTSRPGELREPIQIENWFLVVRLESYRPASLDDATRQQMIQELFQLWAQEEAERRISNLTRTLESTQAG